MTHFHVTPHLTTALTGPLHLFEKQLLLKQTEIETWFQSQWIATPAPIYGSVDLRNAGFKLAPVDMNLFPAGFNNLNPAFSAIASRSAKRAILASFPTTKKIVILPESHTRNIRYWENVKILLQLFIEAGFETKIGTLLPDFSPTSYLTLHDNSQLFIETLKRENNKIVLKDFLPDVILLNNDLSDGIPEILRGLSQPIIPPAELGWSQRLKSAHFKHYAETCDEFAKVLEIDPWVISPLFRYCGEVDFMQKESQTCLASHVNILLKMIQQKYDDYHITEKPYVVIKADAGTYGMAVMMVKSAEEVLSLNRKKRVSMSKSKGGQPVNRVIIQEGVYTFETWGEITCRTKIG